MPPTPAPQNTFVTQRIFLNIVNMKMTFSIFDRIHDFKILRAFSHSVTKSCYNCFSYREVIALLQAPFTFRHTQRICRVTRLFQTKASDLCHSAFFFLWALPVS